MLDGSRLDALWIFGSEARGSATAVSDLDIAGLFARSPSAAELLELRTTMSEALGRPIDLVDLDQAGPVLGMQVIKSGRLVFERTPAHRTRFLAALPGRYEDVRRMQAPIERAMRARLAHGRA